MNTNSTFKKVSLFGKSLDANGNPNPFGSSPADTMNKSNIPLQSLQPQSSVTFPVANTKNPFGQMQQQQNEASIVFNNSANKVNQISENPFAKVYTQTNSSNNLLPTGIPKTSAAIFKPPEQQTTTTAAINSFFKTTASNPMNSQSNNVFNKTGTTQQASNGIFASNTQNTPNTNNLNNIFTSSNKIFGAQTPTYTNNSQPQQQAFFNNNSNNQAQQNGIFAQIQPQNCTNFNSQNANVFAQNQQNQHNLQQNIFTPAQQNAFCPQQQLAQQMLHQPNVNMSDALSHYLHLYKQHIGQKHPFQHAMPGQSYNLQANHQFNPQEQNGDYFMFLNHLVNNESIRRNATPWEIFDFAEGWANRVSEQKNRLNLTPEQEEARKEVNKLFDLRIDPALYQLKMKELPPIQFTMELLHKMNEPFSCRTIISQLWLRLKDRYSVIMNSLKEVASSSDNIRIRELPYYKQMLIMRKQIQNLVEKVTWLKQKDKQIKKEQHDHREVFQSVLQKYKSAFSQVNLNNNMLDSSNQELEKLIDYIDKHLKNLFKAYIQNQPISFQDPDTLMLQVSHFIGKQMNGLNKIIDDHLAIQNNNEQSVDFLELTENVCNFYEEIAGKLYDVREKMKKIIQVVVQHRSYASYQELHNKIEEKAKELMNQKMVVYNKIRDIEQIIEGKSQVASKRQSRGQNTIRSRIDKIVLSPQKRYNRI